jgi:hypothetical protein
MRERHQLFFGLQPFLSKEFHRQIKTEQYFGGFFSSKCASQDWFEHMQTVIRTCRRLDFIFFAELCVPNIFKREKPIVDFSIQCYHADLTGLYIYVKC